MALKTFTKDIALGTDSGSGVSGTLRVIVTEDSINSSTNKSSCTYTAQLIVSNSGRWRASSGSWSLSGSGLNASGSIASMTYYSGTTTLGTGTFTTDHANDGTGSLSINGSFTSTFLFNGSGTLTGTLTTIPRYATVTNTYSNLQETSVKVSWSSDVAVKKVQYRLNGGSWVTVENNVNKTSGNYTISGLSANTSYTIDCDYQRRDSDQYSYAAGKSNSLSIKTYQYPYVKSVVTSSLIVGNQQQLKIYNPLGRSLTVYMKQNNTSGTTLYSGSTSSSGNEITFTFTPNSTTLANSIPDDIKGNAVYYCTYSGQTVQTVNGTYNLVESNIKPTFSVSNWSYTARSTYLTNDNQKVIKGVSTITFSVDTAATAYTGATITKYKVEWGDKSTYIVGSTGTAYLSAGTEIILKVTAIDSREQTTTTELNLGDNLIDYHEPTVVGSTEREDGISEDTTLSFNGTFFNNTFGASGIQNEILYAAYAISTDGVTYGENIYIPVNDLVISGNNFSLTDYYIHLNGTSGGFPIGTRYYIKVEVADYTSIIENAGIIITDGKIAVDCYQDSNGDYHRGINGLGDDNYNQKIHGSENITGNLTMGGQVIKHSGAGWIKARDNAVIKQTNGSSDGAYHPVFSQKTKNGEWSAGQVTDSDLLLFQYTTDSDYANNINTYTRAMQLDPTGDVYFSKNIYANNLTSLINDFYYKAGDSLQISIPTNTLGRASTSGWVTSSTTEFNFSITTPKSLVNVSGVTVNTLKLNVRHGTGGYLGASGHVEGGTNFYTSSYDVFVRKSADNMVSFLVRLKTGTFSGVTNNTPLAIELNNVKVTFS